MSAKDFSSYERAALKELLTAPRVMDSSLVLLIPEPADILRGKIIEALEYFRLGKPEMGIKVLEGAL